MIYDPFSQTAPSSIVGQVFVDTNGNGVQDPGEGGLAGTVVYIDANNNGGFDNGEISTVTDTAGQYRFDGLQPGNYVIREVVPTGTTETAPSPNAVVDDGLLR